MKGTSVHIKNMSIKQLCNRNVRDFAMALQAPTRFRRFRETGPRITKVNRNVIFLVYKCFSLLLFSDFEDLEIISSQNRRPNNRKGKPHRKVTKQSKFSLILR